MENGALYVMPVGSQQTPEAVRLSEERLRALVIASSDVVYRMSADWAVMYQLTSHLEENGFLAETEQANANWLQEYIHPDDQERVFATTHEAIRTKSIFEMQHRVLRADGSLGWTMSRAVPVLDEQGEIREWFGMASDVTGREHAKERESDLNLQLQHVLEATADSVFNLDRNWNFTYLNGNARTLLSTYGELLGRNFWQVFPDTQFPDSPFIEHYHRAMDEGLPGEFEAYYNKPEGWFQVFSYPSRNGISVFFRDITEKRRASEAMIQTEKLAAVGRLAASIAHEVNNPLEAVTNLLYLARTSEHLDDVREYLRTAEAELSRAAAITNQTLRFHKQSTKPTEITPGNLLQGVLAIYRGRLAPSRVVVDMRVRSQKPVCCFEGEIRQLLGNLIGNAIDAMQPNGGRLLLRIREGTDWRTGRAGALITVADTGPGMTPHTVAKAFEAFYSTKGMAGTGLGLWICKEIAARHEGFLRLRSSESRAHHGTVFLLFLPYDAVTREA